MTAVLGFPPLQLNAIEAIYVGVNGFAWVLTVYALIDARQDALAVRALNGKAREIVTDGNVRREWFRLGMQTALLILAIPAAFRSGDTPLTLGVVVLIALSILLLASTAFDALDRRRLGQIVGIVGHRRRGDPEP